MAEIATEWRACDFWRERRALLQAATEVPINENLTDSPRSVRLLLILAGMEAELDKFGLHGEARDAEPAGRLGLIALGLVDGPLE